MITESFWPWFTIKVTVFMLLNNYNFLPFMPFQADLDLRKLARQPSKFSVFHFIQFRFKILPYDPQETLSAMLACLSSSCRAFLSTACSILANCRKTLLNRVTSLLSMRGMLLQRARVMTIGLSINGRSHPKNPVWRERTRLISPEVGL